MANEAVASVRPRGRFFGLSRRRVKKSIVKLLTALITAYMVSQFRGKSKAASEPTIIEEEEEEEASYLPRYEEEGEELLAAPVLRYESLVMQALLALLVVVLTAVFADARRESGKESVEKPVEKAVEEIPSKERLEEQLRLYKENLERATALRSAHLSGEQNKDLDDKFIEITQAINMTEELLMHLPSAEHRAKQRRRARRTNPVD